MLWIKIAVTVNLVFTLYLVIVQIIRGKEEKLDKEKKHLIKVYTDAYDKLLDGIRKRQHEFQNHITALKGMNYIYQDFDELVARQNEYCSRIMEDNQLNHLVYNCKNPVLDGFLYTKVTYALDLGIKVKCEAYLDEPDEKKYDIFDLIEAAGILIDNAVEAVCNSDVPEKQIRIFIHQLEDERIIIKVMNIFPFVPNEELQKFFVQGYSTKEEGRGLGLQKLKKLAEKHGGEVGAYNDKRGGERCVTIEAGAKYEAPKEPFNWLVIQAVW